MKTALTLVGTVTLIETLGASARTVRVVNVDPRFVVVLQVERAPEDSPFTVGAEASLGIHSVSRTFMAEARDVTGGRYAFTLSGEKTAEGYRFSHVQAASASK